MKTRQTMRAFRLSDLCIAQLDALCRIKEAESGCPWSRTDVVRWLVREKAREMVSRLTDEEREAFGL